MADISKINGNNLKDASAREDIADLKAGSVAAGKAAKLSAARTIALGTAASGSVNFDGSASVTLPVTGVKEAYLSWGGKNIAGNISPIDAAASSLHSANRLQFAKPAGITIEYSNNGGTTWTDYGASDAGKIRLVSGIGNSYTIGKKTADITTSDQLRITLNATNMGLYTYAVKFLINVSTNGATGCQCKVERAMKGSEDTFSTVGTYSVSGWSGWNSIPVSNAFGGGATQTSNVAVFRFTFSITGLNSSYSNALSVLDMVLLGYTYWSYPSTMAKTGHLYSWDYNQNATFPAKVSAPGGFEGSLTGTATKATQDGNGNIITATYATKSENADTLSTAKAYTDTKISNLGTVLTYKGSVATYADLPTSGNTAGDTYNVAEAYGSIPAGTNWTWNGSAWDALGGTVDLSLYATKTLVNSIQNTASSAYTAASSAKTKADNNATDITALQSKFTAMGYRESAGYTYLDNVIADFAMSTGTAAKTQCDWFDQDIAETYIKGIEYNPEGSQSGNLCLTITYGTGDTVEMDFPYDTYTLPKSTSSVLGGIKVGYTANEKNYPVVLDTNGNAYVNVPWVNTDTNTTYTAGAGLQLNGTTFNLVEASSTALGGVKLGYTENANARLYAVKADGNGNAYVSVPWSDTNTHYTSYLYAGASGTQTNGTTTNGNTYLKLVESDIIRSSRLIKGTGATTVTSDSSGAITIYTPSYSLPAATSATLGGIKTGYSSTDNYRAVQLDSSNNGYVYIPAGSTSQAGLISATDKTYLDKAMRVSGAYMYANATSGNGSSYQGYYDFINSDGKRLKLVWGFTAASSGKMTVSFRSAFPNACIGVWMSLYNTNTDNSLPGYKITARSSTSFTAYCMYRQLNGQGWESQPWFWIAIGY